MKKIKVTQVRSNIGSTQRQRANLIALGLKRRNDSRVHEARPEVLGMVQAVHHLVDVEEV